MTGSIVQDVKSIPIPMTAAESSRSRTPSGRLVTPDEVSMVRPGGSVPKFLTVSLSTFATETARSRDSSKLSRYRKERRG